jgi:hypothetical protein
MTDWLLGMIVLCLIIGLIGIVRELEEIKKYLGRLIEVSVDIKNRR